MVEMSNPAICREVTFSSRARIKAIISTNLEKVMGLLHTAHTVYTKK